MLRGSATHRDASTSHKRVPSNDDPGRLRLFTCLGKSRTASARPQHHLMVCPQIAESATKAHALLYGVCDTDFALTANARY